MNAPGDIKLYMEDAGRRARAAARRVARADTATKNRALAAMAAAVRRAKAKLLAANTEDVAAARAAGSDTAFVDRLTLNEKGIEAMAQGLEQVAALPDPVGEISELRERPGGIQHTDAIVTEDQARAQRFLREVDSSSVMVNASIRFADGFEYGLGAEIGISTDKLHARGPVGLEGFTSQKYVVFGSGQVRT